MVDEKITTASDEEVIAVSEEIISQNKAVYEELAK